MIRTCFTELVDCTAPIQLASMPGVSTPELVAAVAAAGGLGMLPSPLVPPAALEQMVRDLGDRGAAFGVNFLVPFLDPACVPIAARGARLVEFFYGDPDPVLVDEVHALGSKVSWQVGSLAEAMAAERAGCDLIVAQGTEAGGHVRGQTSLFPFLSEVLDAVEIPVLAAGGVATGRDLAAVLAAGASGARIGTRFVAAAESGAHPDYVAALLAADAADTCLTEAFSTMWPNAPHRVLRSAVMAAAALGDGQVGEARMGDQAIPIERFSVICPSAETTGNIAAMALYAGESVTNVKSVQPAAEIVAELVNGAERELARASGSG